MTERDFKVGDIVTIAGHGEGVLQEVYPTNYHVEDEERTWRVWFHGNINYWLRQNQILRKATEEQILNRHFQAAARGLDCKDPDCWCRRYVP